MLPYENRFFTIKATVILTFLTGSKLNDTN